MLSYTFQNVCAYNVDNIQMSVYDLVCVWDIISRTTENWYVTL
jgi:hypothetical protein